jgi:hypothetical protein
MRQQVLHILNTRQHSNDRPLKLRMPSKGPKGTQVEERMVLTCQKRSLVFAFNDDIDIAIIYIQAQGCPFSHRKASIDKLQLTGQRHPEPRFIRNLIDRDTQILKPPPSSLKEKGNNSKLLKHDDTLSSKLL